MYICFFTLSAPASCHLPRDLLYFPGSQSNYTQKLVSRYKMVSQECLRYRSNASWWLGGCLMRIRYCGSWNFGFVVPVTPREQDVHQVAHSASVALWYAVVLLPYIILTLSLTLLSLTAQGDHRYQEVHRRNCCRGSTNPPDLSADGL